MISPNPYNKLKFLGLSFIFYITNWQILIKFWDGSCSSLKGFAPYGRNDGGGSCSEKNAIASRLQNGKKKGCTMIQDQNQFTFFCGNNGRKISSTFFLSNQNITNFDWVIDMDSFLFLWYSDAKLGAIPTGYSWWNVIRIYSDLLHYLHYNNTCIKQLMLIFSQK